MTSVTVTRKNPNALVRIRTAYEKLAKLEIAQGWTEGEDPEDVTIAAINYFGAPAANIPARDALGPATRRTARKAQKVTAAAGRAANRGSVGESDLQPLADDASADLKEEIRQLSNPPNAPATIKKKGFGDPLIGKGGGRILDSAGAVVRNRS